MIRSRQVVLTSGNSLLGQISVWSGVTILLVLFLAGLSQAVTMVPLTVKKGTNLIHLTRKFCTSHYHWKEIARINGLKEPYLIRPGETVSVPMDLLKIEKLAASVSSVSGTVFLFEGEKTLKKVQNGDKVLPGQTLVTGEDGFTHLIFPDHKYTRVSSNSKFTLTYLVRLVDASLKAEFFLEKGKITHVIKKKLQEGETFSTRTPVSVTGVRGTEYRLKMEAIDFSQVETLKGEVQVAGTEKSITVPGGTGTKIARGENPEPPRRLPDPPAPLVAESIYKKLPIILPVPPANGGAKLRLRVTTDPQGQHTVLEQLASPGDNFTLLALEDGTFYGFLTAIDSDGFESLPTRPAAFSLRTVPGAPVMKNLQNGRAVFDKQLKSVWLKTEKATLYRVQLARDAGFTDIVADKTLSESYYLSPELSPGRYFFRVQSQAADGFRSLFSEVDTWKVEKQPSLGSVSASGEEGIKLQWANMGAEITYDVQLSKNKSFTEIYAESHDLTVPQLQIDKVLDAGRYYVRVRGVLPDGQQSPWSPYQELTIEELPFRLLDGAVLLFFGALIAL